MASGQGIVEHYYRLCECVWQQPCATTDPGFRPQITNYKKQVTPGTPPDEKKRSNFWTGETVFRFHVSGASCGSTVMWWVHRVHSKHKVP